MRGFSIRTVARADTASLHGKRRGPEWLLATLLRGPVEIRESFTLSVPSSCLECLSTSGVRLGGKVFEALLAVICSRSVTLGCKARQCQPRRRLKKEKKEIKLQCSNMHLHVDSFVASYCVACGEESLRMGLVLRVEKYRKRCKKNEKGLRSSRRAGPKNEKKGI